MRRLAFTFLFFIIISSSAYAADCGGDMPCACGDRVIASRTLTALDAVTAGECHSMGLYINTSDVVLDCGGRTIEGPGVYDGIRSDANMTEIRNCRIRNFRNGIFLEGSNQSVLSGNTVWDNSRAGIFINNSIGVLVQRNTADGNGDGVGIYAIGGLGSVYNWNSANNNGRGIAIASTANVQLNNNTASSNKRYGIYLFSTTLSELKDNTADMNGLYGVYLLKDSNNNRLDRNEISGNLEGGLHLDPTSDEKIKLIENRICKNSLFDIHVVSPGSPYGSKNVCDKPTDWSDGGYDNCTFRCTPGIGLPSDCFDGTPSGVCSSVMPLYCDDGVLRYNCTICDCPVGQACDMNTTQGCYIESVFRCDNTTRYGECALIKPRFCEEGTMVDNCNKCGCPAGKGCNMTSGKCFTVDLCRDGTPYGACSSDLPYKCQKGKLVENCTSCGCPEDTVCNGSSDACHMVPCEADQDCPGQYCHDSYCRDKEDLGSQCASDIFCGSGHCVSGVCVYCISDEECPTSDTCTAGACTPVPCPDGVRKQHQCFPYECDADQDCASNQECLNRYCSVLFCLEDQVVEDHECVQRPFVLPEYAFYMLIGLAAVIIIGLVQFYRGRKHRAEAVPEAQEEEE